MLTYIKKGIIRVKVGILDKSQLPLTTNLVFGTEGYHITYTLEEDSFELAIAPADDIDPMDQDDFRMGNGNAEDTEIGSASKRRRPTTVKQLHPLLRQGMMVQGQPLCNITLQ